MEFTVIGHACLRVETAGPTILVDPWLFGSCYWRSWWHFPEEKQIPDEWLAPDVVYLTHHHFDHFHYPSLRRLDKDTHVVVSEFGVDVMVAELHGLGFHNVTEVGHGKPIELGAGVSLTSYQYGFDDTCVVIADADTTLVDLNDCKIRGRALEHVARDHPRPTFMFKTHSWAQSYPNLYTADDPADLTLVRRETYLAEFVESARVLAPEHAVPFANMVAFLHPESWAVNEHMITPDEVAVHFEAAALKGSALTPMSPGDAWSAETGFELSGDDWWEDRLPRMAARAAELALLFDDLAEAESERVLNFEVFAAYLERFLAAVPRVARRRLLDRPVVFRVPTDPDGPFWVVDGRAKTVSRRAEEPPDAADLIDIAPAVLADAIDSRILHFVHGSMRIRTHLRPGGVEADLAFWGLLMVWEIGYLPMRSLLSPRAVRAGVRRWREGYEMTVALGGRGNPLRRLAEGFAEPGAPTQA